MYKHVGAIFALALVYGSMPPGFLSPLMVACITGSAYEPTIEDVRLQEQDLLDHLKKVGINFNKYNFLPSSYRLFYINVQGQNPH